MTIDELVAEIRGRSLQLRKSGDELLLRGKQEALDSTLISELRTHKAALFGLIGTDSDTWWSPPITITPEMLPLVRLTTEEIKRIVSDVPRGAANVQDIYPLSPLQEGIFFHHLIGGEGDPYLLAILVSFESRGRLDSYVKALQAVIDRHDILRTAVVWEGLPHPVQVVWRKAALPLEEVVVDASTGDVGQQLYARFDPRHYRIDVRQAPLMRLYIAYDLTQQCWWMVQLLHHLAGDHSTMEVMQEEVQVHLLGRSAELPAPLPFRNLVAQARLGVSAEEHEAFFRQMLGDVEEPTAPFGLLDVQGDGSGLKEERMEVDRQLARRLRERVRQLGVSAASLCHVAWAQVLAKVSGRGDVVFGTVLVGRMQGGQGSDRAMGPFINTLPVRIRIGEEGAESSVRRAQILLANLLRHEHASLALAQRCSGVPAPRPLFSAVLNYRRSQAAVQAPSEDAKQAWEGMRWIRGVERSSYPFTMVVDDLGEGLWLTARTQATINPSRVCEFMRTALEALVCALETAPATAVRSLAVLPEAERRQLLEEWNDTQVEFPGDECVHELFEAQVRRSPNAVAVVFEERKLTYTELNRQANQLAHYLRGLGVKPDTRVALCVERSLEMMVGLLAVLKAGGAYVPMDPLYPDERLSYMLQDSSPVALLTQDDLAVRFAGSEGLPVLDLRETAPVWRDGPETNLERDAIGLAPNHLAYVIYTSGSTGMPKGVMIEHRNLSNYLRWSDGTYYRASGSGSPAVHSIGFDGLVTTLFGPIMAGQTLRLLPLGSEMDALGHGATAEITPYTLVKVTPSHLKLLNRAISGNGNGNQSPTRALMIGGEALVPSDVVFWQRRFPEVRLVNHFGPTETTVGCCTYEIERPIQESNSIPIGRPIANTRMYILDENRQPVPIGVTGEIYIGGAGVARGYLNRPEMTAERFVKDPFCGEGEARMYRSGDLGRWLEDGAIEYLGRNDFQVKVRGFRIELGEIEARLAEYEGVREAVVVAREDTPGDQRLVAYYTCTGGRDGREALGAEELRRHLSAQLPEYMVPAAYVRLEKLPLTPNGKLDRKALPAPEGDAYVARGYQEPLGEIETKMAEIWAEVLKVERVGRHDNFFELGGHSLLAVTVMERMRRQGLHADVRTLFATPTLAELAATVGLHAGIIEVPPNRIPLECEAITPEMLPLVRLTAQEVETIVSGVSGGAANVQDIYPLAPLQEGIFFHHLIGGEGDPYLSAVLVSFESRTRLDSYVKAFQAVIDRHDILRTAVVWEGLPDPVQVVWRKAALPLEEVAVDAGTGDVGQQLYARFDPRHYRIDVRYAPLVRLSIAYDSTQQRWLMMQLRHHLVGDHSTLEVMQQEVQAHLLGRGAELPAPLPFRNLVAQARLGVSAEEHEAFFRQMLGDVEEPTAPFGLLDVQDDSGLKEERVEVDRQLARRLRERVRQLGVSAASLCHVAWAQVLAKVSGRGDVVFGTVLVGRMQGGQGSDRAMGPFINTLPVRIRIGEEGAESSVRRTHALLADLLRHEHASLALAQRCSGVPAPRPLFSALLNYRHSQLEVQAPSEDAKQAWEGIRGLFWQQRATYPIIFCVDDLGEGFALTARTQAPINPLRVCEFMRTALEGLVCALETAPATAVRSLAVLPEAERHQLLVEWNDTTAKFPSQQCIHELFEAQVLRTPYAVAVTETERSLTYAELNRRANRLAHSLRDQGVGPEVRVALYLERSLEMVVGLLAVLKAGGAYVPLDSTYPAERVRYMLEDSRVAAVLTQEKLREGLPWQQPNMIVIDGKWEQLAEEREQNPETQVQPENLAYVIYTSGSTGVPKGVCIEHRHLSNYVSAIWSKLGLSEGCPFGLVSTVAADLGNTVLFPSLTHGGTLRVLTREETTDSHRFASSCREHPMDCIKITPSHFQALLAEGSDEQRIPGKRLVFGGEVLPRDLVSSVRSLRPECRIYNHYGPTECTVGVLSDDVTSCTQFSPNGAMPLGRPMSNMCVYILDSHHNIAPVGIPGEIFIGGHGVGRGYFCRPDLTAERFFPNPFSQVPGERIYSTGDLGRWLQDGSIEFLGRNDFQVKIRGFRIELGEIQARLAQHDGVREAVVVVREDTPGDQRLVAYYTCAAAHDGSDGAVGTEELRRHLSAQLPEYMVPAAYVRLEKLPLTPNGKLDRQALPAPEGNASMVREYREPVGEMETRLAEIWAAVLKVERVGRQDNFFELGGHSLLVVRVIARLRRTMNVEVTVGDLFAHPVLADFARTVEKAASAALPSITPAERGERIPLSFAQQRLWFLAQMEGGSEAYHISRGMRLSGKLDRTALRQALDRIVARHEALRTRFVLIDGEPVQQIAPEEETRFELLEHDLRQHPDAKTELDRLLLEEARTSFDLEHGPLIRGRLVCEAEDEHALLITMHHIVSDGWSMGILNDELSALYGAFLRGEEDPLPELKVQYADYALWQRKWIVGDILQQQADYWKTTLAGAPALLELPADHERPAQQNYAGGYAGQMLDEELTARLEELSKRQGTTLFMTLLAAWAALLGRLSRQADVVIGTAVANRGRSEIEGLIGFFVNTLALRLDLSGSPTVEELLERVKTQSLAAQQHQDIPFEQVVELMQPVRSLTHSPLFQVMFTWQNNSRGQLEFSGLEVKPLQLASAPHAVSKFDMTLSMWQVGQNIGSTLQYASGLFEPSTVERYLGYFRTLLEAMVVDDTQPVDRLPLLSDRERRQLLEEWNDTQVKFPGDECVHELFEAQVRRSPNAVAVVFEERKLTYTELNRQANQLAHYLRGLGVKPDTRVALCVERSLEMMVGLLAVLKAGGAYVPMDPLYPDERLSYMLQDSSPVALLTQGDLAARFPGNEGLPVLDLRETAAVWRDGPETNLERDAIGLAPNHLAYVIYTSGSTGMPKGVMIEHRNLSNYLRWSDSTYYRASGSGSPAVHSIGFDGLVTTLFGPIMAGQTLRLLPLGSEMDALGHGATAETPAYTLVKVTPSHLKLLNRAISGNGNQSPTRALMIGGEALVPSDVVFWQRRFPEVRLVNHFGPTETTVGCCTYEIEGPIQESNSIPIGRPIANTRMYILDENRQAVPIGVTGEIYIGGAGVARGYLNRPEMTAERFVKDPFWGEAEARMYRSGDLGRWLADGAIEYLGRNDFQVKVRGFRIELGEIEARLAEHEGVREAVVMAREDTPGDQRLVAYYICAGERDGREAVLGAEELRRHLSTQLPEYMVPAAYVRLEKLPVTPNGKLDRKALPAPEGNAYVVRGYQEPLGEIETKMAEIWAEVLKVERVGRHDNFFELGGRSLLVVRVLARLRQTMNVEVTVGDLFAHPVLADFARSVEKAASAAMPSITASERGERIPLSFAQQRLWFLAQMEGGSEAYHIFSGMRLSGKLNRAALRQALDRIVARHEALRTMFVQIDGEPVQRIMAEEESRFELLEHDLSQHPDAKTELDRLLAEEARTSFDLEHGPPIRGRLVREAEEEHALLITMHHIVSDGWSMGIFNNELSALYGAFLRGEADPLPELKVQYADYALWQRKWMAGEVLEQQAEYWKKNLAGAPELLELPTDHPRPAQQNYAGGFAGLALGEELTARLEELSKRQGITLFMTFLAAWAVLLGRLSGQQDIVIGTPTANRGHSDIEGLIGFFVNTLAIRLDLSGSPTVGELLERVKIQALAAQQHQDIPFEQVVELAQPVRSLAHSPLFQVMFVWQGNSRGRLEFPGLGVKPLQSAPHVVSKFDLTLLLRQEGQNIGGPVEYASGLFEPSTVERYLGYFRSLLEAMVVDDAQTVDRLSLLNDRERRQILKEWNETEAEFASDKCVHELFEEQVRRRPGAVAVVDEARKLTYGELNRRANQLAYYLRGLGVKPDSRVAIAAERGLEMTLGLLAILKAGGAYVPLDPAYPAERLSYMLQDSSPTALLTQSHLLGQFTGLGNTLPIIDMAVVNPPWQNHPETNPDPASVGLTPGHIAYIIYTSGSTGVPKGAMIQHRNVNNLACAQQHIFGVSDSDRILQFFSFSFDVSMFAIVMALSSGARMVLAKGEELLPGPALIGLLQREEISVATLPPAVLSYLPDAELPELRTVILGGESWNEELVERWGEGRRIFNSYGPTETTVQATVKEHRAGEGKPNIGRPMRNVRIYLLDAEGNPAPVGTPGELYIGGAGLGRGYLDNALTGERFVPDPFSGNAGVRLYRTGDWARWLPDGNIDLLGRKDEQVKIRGFRIELGEIGARLMEHAGVREAAVIAREDTPGDHRLVAYYTCAETAAEGQGVAVVVSAESLRAHLSGRLPEYMVPAAYVRVQSLPLTPHGKLDHKSLPAPDVDSYAAQGYEAPQGKVETTLAGIWRDVLKLERIGRHDSFFALGGHSLLIFRVVNLLAQEGITIQAADIFTHPTIDSLAAKIGLEGMRALADRAVCIRKDGMQPPLFLTHCGSGELLYVAALAPHIDTSVPIYGLPHRAGDEAQLRTVEGMAIRMVQMIRAVQPVGPYHIAGWSFGGVLAYEIAVQLIGADQEVAFLGMLDTSYPARERNLAERRVEDFTDIDLLLSAVRAGKSRDQEQQAAISEIESSAATMNFEALVRKCREMALLPDILEGFTASQIQQILIRQRGLMAASRAYSVQPLPIPVHLFATTEGNPVDPVSGWSAVVPPNLLRVTRVTGTHHSMMVGPNVEALGKTFSNEIRNAAGGLGELPERSYASLTTLQSGRHNVAPLFCVPGAGASITSFVELAGFLEEERPIYGLQPRGLEGELVPHSTVQAACQSYLPAILDIYRTGPPHLLGHSFGGWVVFDIAQRLLENGRAVGSLTILDSEVPESGGEYNNTEAIMAWLEIFEQILERPLDVGRSDLDLLNESAQRKLLHERLVREGLVPPRTDPGILQGPLRTFAMSLRTHYRPDKVYPGPVQLILVDNPKLDQDANRRSQECIVAGWRQWAPNLVCTRAPGNHMTVLKGPHVQTVARLLQNAMSDIRSKAAPKGAGS